MGIDIEKDGLTGIQEDRAREAGIRLFLRYDIGVSMATGSGISVKDMKEPWDMLYKFIAGMKPIAGSVKVNERGYLDKDTPDVEMWFLSRIPALPSELNDWIKESGYHYKVKINSWQWGPQGINALTEEQLAQLEGTFNSNLVMKEFLSVDEEQES